jgi:Fe-S cluster biosynthesis and repair protein YggX
MEDNAKVKKAVNEVQAVYDKCGKQEWVEWAGKNLMLRLHAQIEMERADAMRAEQDAMEEERYQAERAEHEQECAAKEAELEVREEEYINWSRNK